MIMNNKSEISIIGTDGRVRWYTKFRALELVQAGKFNLIQNPTQEYYPQYDQTRGGGDTPDKVKVSNILGDVDFLPVKMLC